MGLIDLASNASAWRGYDYYKDKKVISYERLEESEYSGTIKGSADNSYHVKMNMAHPRQSKCNCPHANGRRVICKHIVALCFTIFPKEAERFIAEVEEYEREEEKRQQEELDLIEKCVNSLSRKELRESLISYMIEEQEEKYRRFS